MDPLVDLDVIENWTSFQPSTKGFLSPDVYGLPDHEEVFGTIGDFLEELRPNDAVIASSKKYMDALQPGLILQGSDSSFIGFPISTHDVSLLQEQGVNASGGAFDVHASKLDFMNPRWEEFARKAAQGLLIPLHADGVSFVCKFSKLSLRKVTVEHSMEDTQSHDPCHFATVFITLPSRITSGSLSISHIVNGQVYSAEQLDISTDSLFSSHVLATYTGVEATFGSSIEGLRGSTDYLAFLTYEVRRQDGSLDDCVPSLSNISGAHSGLRDIFRAWRFTLEHPGVRKDTPGALLYMSFNNYDHEELSHGTSVLEPDDMTIIAHIAPLAKLYGFNVYFTHLTQVSSEKVTQLRGYKDYDCEYKPGDFDEVALDLRGGTATWQIYNLNGSPLIEPGFRVVESHANKIIQEKLSYGSILEEIGPDSEIEFDDVSIYEDTLKISATRKISGIMVVPV